MTHAESNCAEARPAGPERLQPTPESRQIWASVDALVDRAPRADDLVDHGLHLLAARRWRARGRTVPPEFVEAERTSALISMMVAPLLARAREASDLPIVVYKGPEIARRFRDPTTRPFCDIDILTTDAPGLQQALIAAGFEEFGDPELYRDIHHLRPLRNPSLPLAFEIHSAPKWLDHGPPPPTDELFEAAVPSGIGVDGILALPPAHHLVVLAAHSWAHEPLRRLLDIVDVAVLSTEADRREVEAVARRFGMERAWRTTIEVADSLLLDERRRPLALHLWARNLGAARGRTVLEAHLAKWIGPFWAYPPRIALTVGAEAFLRDLRPGPAEGWRRKLARTGLAIAGFARRRSDHDHLLERRPNLRPRRRQ